MTRIVTLLFTLLLFLPAAVAAGSKGKEEGRKPNHLVNEASPYLRQHAYNPINWYPWGKEAFEKARKEDKPILLSVGYATCHWCHVMARESFEDKDIAEVINLNFVAIKVDRERRPDVDETYMLATQLITEAGGWPNNVFMTPDLKPFFGGTYFPPEQFKSLLVQVALLWRQERKGLEADAQRLAATIDQIMTSRVEAAELTPETLNKAVSEILDSYDAVNGGFMKQPKFPQESILLFLLRMAEKDGNEKLLKVVTHTLDNMLNGGLQDHVGGGFHRYAVDSKWRVPHFEKMLYTQALITQALLRAHMLSGKTRYAHAARRTLDYVLDDMTSPQGGFYSARDADSGGEEGTFYVWSEEQIEKALGKEDAGFAKKAFGVTFEGNYENSTTILHFPAMVDQLSKQLGMDEAAFTLRIDKIRTTLNKVRQSREAPFRDEKLLSAWNGMMITAFAEAAQVLDEERYRDAAIKAGTFIWENMRDGKGLKRAYFEGKAVLEGQQEDHAYMALAYIALHDLTGEKKWLERAETLTDEMVKRFRDDKAGDYYMTASAGTFGKAKARADAGTPSGNAVALEVFAKLSQRSRKPDHRLRGEALLAAISGVATGDVPSNAYTLYAADLLLRGAAGPRQFMAKGTVDARAILDAGKSELTVRLKMTPGWHVNSDKPLEEFFTPTVLKVEGAGDAKVLYPQAVKRKLGFHDKELALYEGSVDIKVALPKGLALPIKANLRLQACSDEVCLEPQNTILTLRK